MWKFEYAETFFRFFRWTKQQGERFLLNRNVSYWNVRTLTERFIYENCSNINRTYT